ncbi:MAG: HAD-IB family phosphatase [Pseudomonadota bacterium]|uniref:HAD-IB family phosphatase n=1 Tax=Thermithiobacillus tepidarius TaxID=929 RepID=UPI0004017C4F|nr:HAD-IB family phosphatase [Thermithiobacillus tepidarius]
MSDAARSYAVFCDFDGTITRDETFVAVLKHFAPETSARLLPEMYALRLSLREGVRRILESIPCERYPEILDFVRGAPLRVGFPEFLAFLGERQVPFVIISGGLLGIVRTILGPLAGQVAAIYAADVACGGATLQVLSPWEAGDELVSKPLVMARYPGVRPVCIGDSVTDLNMALRCPTVFARDRLAGYLTERGRAFHPFEDFHMVQDKLTELWQAGAGRPTETRHG